MMEGNSKTSLPGCGRRSGWGTGWWKRFSNKDRHGGACDRCSPEGSRKSIVIAFYSFLLALFYFCWPSYQVTSFTWRKSLDSYCLLFRIQNASGWLPWCFLSEFSFLAAINLCFGRVRQAALEGVAVLGQLLASRGGWAKKPKEAEIGYLNWEFCF